MKKLGLLIVAVAVCCETSFSQCSDAGVCAIGGGHESPQHRLGIRYAYGASGKADDLTFHSVHLEGTIQVLAEARVNISLPWSRAQGPLGSVSGLGDLTVLWNQVVWEGAATLEAQVGGKVAVGSDNAGGLPQAYQPGLGTNDLLFGVSLTTEPWLLAVGYQWSRGRSGNALTRLRRGDDLLLKAAYQTHIEALATGVEVLAIRRLQNSSVVDLAVSGGSTFVSVSGSDQLQINLVGRVSMPVAAGINLHGVIAFPLLSREVNLDGLTRSRTISFGVSVSI